MSEDLSGKVAHDARPSFPGLRRIDAAWYNVEQWICGVMFLLMALVVFVSVVRDVFQTRWFPIDGNSTSGDALVGHAAIGTMAVDTLIFFGLVLLGVLTRVRRDDEKRRPLVVNVGIAAVITVVVIGAVALYVNLLPEGFQWAAKAALCMMLWVGFLGASMATHEKAHLALEMGEKIWPEKARRFVKAFAHALTTAFCICLFILSLISLADHHQGWVAGDGHADVVPTLEWLPQWGVFIIFPYVFLAMTIRFAAQTVTIATGTDIAGVEVLK